MKDNSCNDDTDMNNVIYPNCNKSSNCNSASECARWGFENCPYDDNPPDSDNWITMMILS